MLGKLLLLLVLVIPYACSKDAVDPGLAPDAPENLLAALRFTEIHLNWRDASTNEDLFRVEFSHSGHIRSRQAGEQKTEIGLSG